MMPTTRHTATRQGHILVVDDDGDARELYAMFLRLKGFVVTGAASAAEALKVVARDRPDLVVTDLVMPGRSGVDLCRDLRQRYPDLPIIAITARLLSRSEMQALDGGVLCDRVLTKPCDPDDLLAALTPLLSRRDD